MLLINCVAKHFFEVLKCDNIHQILLLIFDDLQKFQWLSIFLSMTADNGFSVLFSLFIVS